MTRSRATPGIELAALVAVKQPLKYTKRRRKKGTYLQQ